MQPLYQIARVCVLPLYYVLELYFPYREDFHTKIVFTRYEKSIFRKKKKEEIKQALLASIGRPAAAPRRCAYQ